MRKGEKRMSKYYGMEAQDVRKAVNGGTEPLTAEQIKKNQEKEKRLFQIPLWNGDLVFLLLAGCTKQIGFYQENRKHHNAAAYYQPNRKGVISGEDGKHRAKQRFRAEDQ